jgi:hypothetical protein
VRRPAAAAALALFAAGCAAPPERPQAPGVSMSTGQRVEAILRDARMSEHETDAATRAQLAEDAGREADRCLAAEPQAAGCLYGHALALGLAARAHPAHAGESLKRMLAELEAAEAADAGYDEAGPARVRALVLTRAPGWPLGPGDPEAALVAARRAVDLRPRYPPNQLALAEALAKNGEAAAARAAYQGAHEAAIGLPQSAERDEWLEEADRALQH